MQNKSELLSSERKNRVKKTVLLAFVLATLTGCGGPTYYQWKYTGDAAKYYQDSAQCKLMAKNAANNVQGYNNQTYHVSNYDYGGGYSSSTIEPDYIQEAIGGVIQGLQQNTEGQETYKLCMQSKGYQLIKTISGRPATGIGGHCTVSNQCPDKMLCDEIEEVCISSIDWVKKYDTKGKHSNHGQNNCGNAEPCPKEMVHDGPECKCISFVQWAKKYSE
jgi:hypothetical protein